MGILSTVTGPFVYLDANIFIYALEAHADFVMNSQPCSWQLTVESSRQ
jgi:hypothetical protein